MHLLPTTLSCLSSWFKDSKGYFNMLTWKDAYLEQHLDGVRFDPFFVLVSVVLILDLLLLLTLLALLPAARRLSSNSFCQRRVQKFWILPELVVAEKEDGVIRTFGQGLDGKGYFVLRLIKEKKKDHKNRNIYRHNLKTQKSYPNSKERRKSFVTYANI